MQKHIAAIVFFVVIANVCFAKAPVIYGDMKHCKVVRFDDMYIIKLQGTTQNIGRIEYSKRLKKYVSFACFPFRVPYSHRRAVKEFLSELNKRNELPGRYYIDMSNGEFGYFELSDVPMWNPRDVYKLWPEIFRIVSFNTRVSTVLQTIRMFPLKERTQGDLSKMKEFNSANCSPGEFDYDTFCVEDDFLPPQPEENVPSAVVDRKKIDADFAKLLGNTKAAYHAELKKAVEKQDMEKILQIVERYKLKNAEHRICVLYAAIHGKKSGKENFESAKKWFNEWKPELMMPYLQNAVKAEVPAAEHFMAQFLYRFDLGSPKEIFALFQKSYAHGYEDAEASLARCYWFGFGTARDQKKAFEMAKRYLSKIKNPDADDCFVSTAKTVAGLGYLKLDRNREKGLKLINDPETVQGTLIANTVYFYGLFGVPQSYGKHELGGGLQPHWTHLDVLMEGFPSKRDNEMIRILKYQ